MKYEYKVISLSRTDYHERMARLQAFGGEGWELVQYEKESDEYDAATFKRELSDNN